MDNDARLLFEELSPNILSETRVFRMRSIILSADVFQGLTSRLILILVSTCTEHLFSPGDLIVRKGEVADCMYIVLKGTLSVLVDDEATITVKKIHDHEMFGEVCFLSRDQPRMAWIRAETFSVLSRFDRDRFDDVLHDHQDLKDGICEAIQRTMNKYKEQATDVDASAAGNLHADAHETLALIGEEDCNECTPLMSVRSDDDFGKKPIKVSVNRKMAKKTTIGLNSAKAEAVTKASRNSFTDVIADNMRSSTGRKSTIGKLSRAKTFLRTSGPMRISLENALASRTSSRSSSREEQKRRSRGKLSYVGEGSLGVGAFVPQTTPPAEWQDASRFVPEQHITEMILKLRVGLEMQKDALSCLEQQDGVVLPELGSAMQRECQGIMHHLQIARKSQRQIEELFELRRVSRG
mmetsp:Transcript_110485/g.212881  ORF Transcript_110485/g.212881 Transcript_110485/m.212881 type:complete len:409 (+) Transcript_110485:2-1228(+)